MAPTSQGIIYLAQQRGCTQTEWFRSYHTFNFGTYFSEHRNPFGNIQIVNDETLKESFTLKHHVQEDSIMLLLPVVGVCHYKNNLNTLGIVDVGQLAVFFANKDLEFEISNPYKSELINYLLIGLKADKISGSSISINEFDLDANKNKLVSLSFDTQTGSESRSIYLGKFDGRQEGTFSLKNPEKGIFIFVLEGAFEVQNRLLQPRDGLALWDSTEIEFEALSNNAIILLIENTL